ncbi:hypothetical protein BU586_09000 [Staphylococcus agnetis]|nr:hypothetical protein BU589_11015 [Staphylococcus agnetis]PTH69572.1 hypothetical protein BU586_09000 [Staphylococcus agnetis]PTH76233.1 hypothetical protein BU579_10145 [Staphylococcus agnetis]
MIIIIFLFMMLLNGEEKFNIFKEVLKYTSKETLEKEYLLLESQFKTLETFIEKKKPFNRYG